ncbi:MAG: NHL repeat-containing protein [Planctomycetota bacterium]
MGKIDRRSFLAGCVAASIVGCVPQSMPFEPQLLWGRRGFSDGRFIKPRAIAIDESDQLYIVDTTGRIQVFDADGNFLRGWATPQTENGRPTGLAFQTSKQASDGQSKLLVADTHYYRVLAYSPDGELLEENTIGGTSGRGPGEFAFVTDVVTDANGCFYVGEYNDSDRIQKFDPDGKFICQWGGTGEKPGQFFRPQSLVVAENTLWIADACNHRIQRYDLAVEKPQLIDVVGASGSQRGQLAYPYGLVVPPDSTDFIVVEYKNARVQRFAYDGTCLGVWGGPGLQPGQLNQPWGIVLDSQNRVHVLDSNNHRVQRIAMNQIA